ncbi:MAG: 1-acyl-sn-glycerol-3-phosphate acyltransferase [Yoonia sp.]|tara:strand:- start:1601 stop:2953 length:1353 start_codon:yes stop_codon:yes gene_type:complete
MTQTVSMPIWAFVLILLFAAVTFASHFLFPSVRWFFRKRAERVIAKLNKRLTRPIEPFKLARRYDMIQRLIYDPEVTQAVADYAREEKIPENVAFEKARHYAREIVPSFSATAYFTVGVRFARWLTRMLYRVRLGAFDRDALEKIDPDATVIFVMNHRSNMDYVLVTHLVSRAGSLSYAVGEWARVWPLSSVIKILGAYFIRRRSRGSLYRRVLARYVQLATEGGVTQAMFPEGGLSLTGKVGEAKLGLLSYIVSNTPQNGRDVIFVPVALNYDQVLEDQFLINAGKTGKRRFRPSVWTVVRSCAVYAWWRLRGKFRGFGTASVGFGTPLELSSIPVGEGRTEAVAVELMARIKKVVPILAVPLVARALVAQPDTNRAALVGAVSLMLDDLCSRNMPVPRREIGAMVDDALSRFALRKVVVTSGQHVVVPTEQVEIIAYYADTISHHFDT